jgi:hypothetical protein
MLHSITSTGVAWCDGGVLPVVDSVGSKMMRALVNLSCKLLCVAWRGISHKLDDMWLAIMCTGRIA